MKKALFFVALATLLLQAVNVKAQLGFHAGYAPQVLSTVSADEISLTRSHGFYGGLHYGRSIIDKLGFTAGLQIRLNSCTVNEADFTTQDWQFLVDMPILLNYGFSLGYDMTLGAFAGPMFSYGISYTQKTTDAETYEVIESVDRYGTSLPNLALKRFEVGAAGGLFFKFRSYMLYGGYRMGFNDLDKMDGCITRPRGFLVGLGIN